MKVAKLSVPLCFIVAALCFLLKHLGHDDSLWIGLIFLGLFALGSYDLLQTRHSILRNYPIVGHLRYLQESLRPELRQYFFENDTDDAPFSFVHRALIYSRSKNHEDYSSFGTELDVHSPEFVWLRHSIGARTITDWDFRVTVGGESCLQPYSCSLLNISAMSFGSIGGNAIEAMGLGAKQGGFYQCTGEGGISRHHRTAGADLVWQIGTGYFGCRSEDGSFNEKLFQEKSQDAQIKMIELKISQGAKPGHGGVLPKEKITDEIAETRAISKQFDCISPPGHSAFQTPIELCRFIALLRELSGGKPVGFKICIGHESEFMAVCKAMLKTDIYPDFITIDGKEGGTGAAPIEFLDHVGMPMARALTFVHNTLIGSGLRDRIKIAAAGKVFSGSTLAYTLALGADWCNAARPFMMSVGCIQSRQCHTNRCPVGVATQDKTRQRALVVHDKAPRVVNYHRNTLRAFADVLGAMGLQSPNDLNPTFAAHQGSFDPKKFSLEPGELIKGQPSEYYRQHWLIASADTFRAEIGATKLRHLQDQRV